MSSGIPQKFMIDFSGYERDLVLRAWSRMLSQFWGAPVMKAFVETLITNGPQWAYDEIVKQQEANSLYMAEGDNLDAIGRIVGQPRTPYRYDDSRWLFADRPGQGADQAPAWVTGASLTGNTPASDVEFRQMILARVACNFSRFSSAPEMAYLVEFATGRTASWRRVGPMECEIIVSGAISRTHLEVLTRCATTTGCDDIFAFPYPATLNLSAVTFLPRKPFIADREDGHQNDAGYAAVSRKL